MTAQSGRCVHDDSRNSIAGGEGLDVVARREEEAAQRPSDRLLVVDDRHQQAAMRRMP